MEFGIRMKVDEARRPRAMLDAFIIEELKRREDERRKQERPTLEVPEDEDTRDPGDEAAHDEQDGQRGVIIIDYGA
jgi:hypothetical protein